MTPLWEEASQQFVVPIIAAEMGWSWGYARAVLGVWKARDAYCRAVLIYPKWCFPPFSWSLSHHRLPWGK